MIFIKQDKTQKLLGTSSSHKHSQNTDNTTITALDLCVCVFVCVLEDVNQFF